MEQRRGLGPGNVFVLISTFCLNSAETFALLMRHTHMLDKSIHFLGALMVSFGLAQIYVGYDPEPFGTQTSKWGKCGQGPEQLRLCGQHSRVLAHLLLSHAGPEDLQGHLQQPD